MTNNTGGTPLRPRFTTCNGCSHQQTNGKMLVSRTGSVAEERDVLLGVVAAELGDFIITVT